MTTAISLWETYMIETLIAKGMARETLITTIKNEDVEALNNFDDSFDYADLIEASKKAPGNIEQAIESGYTIKYVSKFGIKRLLGLKFSLQEGTDYQMEDATFYNVRVTEDQLSTLKQMLANHWKVEHVRTDEDDHFVHIIHVTEQQ
ncbi:hypothetical protein SAMN05216389_101290 [Oceanobacillus limi]|uniref:Uncharacterized protein n=1 Tax=Oceanobacillus limi TaxID=930131 RepID=A0A1H9YB36_9BACI|nr:hypothetical protein [Oceanobacillus limi]SES66016.1 hypothetical protein SAMN05216389_101290 [Oceanobacillus limi]